MTFKEIIKENKDRLFIVDTECYIIFTGSSINDERPFIRIGTWYDLPVEIIPLIENIIITDRILGNPAHEQFNIDIRNLVANRYIGGESTLKRFLDYQKNFGLDLTNVSVVNIEKDIPELPRHSNISDRDQFIGVFYSDGNIRIVNDDVDIFNLNSILAENIGISGIQERISQDCKGSDRYSGAGFIIADSNPVFYSGGYFTSYQYPSCPLSEFSSLGIDPSKIRDVLLPSQNILTLSSLMKFKNSREGKIRIFSDNPEQIDLIKKLFKNCTLIDEKFSSMNFNTGDGLKISTCDNSPNIKLVFKLKKQEQDDFTVAFIKLHHDTKKILKEEPDIVLITYTAYEESALLFKSSDVPVIIIDDGNPNISKIGESRPVVKKGIQYEFQKFSSESDLIKQLEVPAEIITAFNEKDTDAISAYIDSLSVDSSDFAQRFNMLTLIRFHTDNTDDRKFYSALKDIQQKNSIRPDIAPPAGFAGNYRIVLGICQELCYQVICRTGSVPGEIFTDTYSEGRINDSRLSTLQRKPAERILADRERLCKLLRHFYDGRKTSGKLEHLEDLVSHLKDEIENRKEVYEDDLFKNGEEYSLASGQGSTEKNSGATASASGTSHGKGAVSFAGILSRLISGKKNGSGIENKSTQEAARKSAIIILLIIITAALFFFAYRHMSRTGSDDKQPAQSGVTPDTISQVITVKRINNEEKALLEKRNVIIRDLDIYNYANDVAIKNGYSRLTYSGLKDKNPHWIYPSNVFIMLDGEKVVVQKGDTLWDLANAKLQKMNADFYKIIEELEKSDPSDKKKAMELIGQAEKFAYIPEQKKIISNYRLKFKNE